MTVEVPTTLDEHIQHCKIRIGEPLLRVNTTDMQNRIAVNKALERFADYHDHATSQVWMTQTITTQIINDGFFVVPDNVEVVEKIETIDTANTRTIHGYGVGPVLLHNGSVVGVNYISNPSGNGLVGLYLAQRNMSYFNNQLRPDYKFDWNYTNKRVTFHIDKNNLKNSDIIAYLATVNILNTTAAFWHDDWLLSYSTALIKKQWADNMSKFNDYTLPGGHSINAAGILEEAKAEIEMLEERLIEEAAVFRNIISIG